MTRQYSITCLLNDNPYYLRVAAFNLYGLGAWEQIGPLTPRWCPHMDYCNTCHEPFFEQWGGCKPPTCTAPPPLPPPGHPDPSRLDEFTRLTNCTDSGCRVEAWHLGSWGRVNGVWLNESAHVACRSLGLRGRPEVCGAGECGAAVGYPPPELFRPIQKVWLTNVSCQGGEISILKCPSNLTSNVSFTTSADDRWGYYDSTEATSAISVSVLSPSANDAGVCCWPMPSFMQQTGHRTNDKYGHIFKTISSLDSLGDEKEADFCCQEHDGECSDGVAVNGFARFTRCYSSSAQQGACTYARGMHKVKMKVKCEP